MKQHEVLSILAVLCAQWPKHEMNEDAAKRWELELLDVQREIAGVAARRIAQSAKWFPSIGEFRKECVNVALGPEIPATEAWSIVSKAVQRFGAYQLPTFESPLIASCVEAFGWQDICLTDHEPSARKRFCDLFEARQALVRSELALSKDLRLPPPGAGNQAISALLSSWTRNPFERTLSDGSNSHSPDARATVGPSRVGSLLADRDKKVSRG
jgi:hypothetical protein